METQVAPDVVLSNAFKSGQSAIFVTNGNPDTHIILRGGRGMTNYGAQAVAETTAKMHKAGLDSRIELRNYAQKLLVPLQTIH